MAGISDIYNQGTALLGQKNYEAARLVFQELRMFEAIEPVCLYHLGAIANAQGKPEEAYDLYYEAFTSKPDLASLVYSDKHSSNRFIYKGMKVEKVQKTCPLCSEVAQPRWCYPLPDGVGYNEFFNPIRMWMYCAVCHHMFARSFPEKLFLHNDNLRRANPAYFPYYSNILNGIRRCGYSRGMELFEIGVGAGECLLAAREMGYTAMGIDVISKHVDELKSLYSLQVETADFNEYVPNKKWDVIIMGDVIEHVSDPAAALVKAEAMLADEGALWISTPSFESAFSEVVGHDDAMRRQQYHLNYFSRESLYMLLDRCGLKPVDYSISSHYNGSMEIVVVKEGRKL